jgi:hypothetical protein
VLLLTLLMQSWQRSALSELLTTLKLQQSMPSVQKRG